ncbi:hypothetical protein [Nocardia nova]
MSDERMPAELHNAIGATITELFRTLGLPAPRFSQRLAVADAVWRRWHPEIEADPQRAPLIQDAFGDEAVRQRMREHEERTQWLIEKSREGIVRPDELGKLFGMMPGGGGGGAGPHPQSAHGIGLGGNGGGSTP